MNEFLYALMRENGIAARLDENISIEFINLNNTEYSKKSFDVDETIYEETERNSELTDGVG